MKHLLPLLALVLCLTGCRTATPPLDYRALVRAADRLGVDIGPKDHHALYLEAAQWIGTPYRSGGQSRKGTDCSGFVRQVYKKVYGIDLPRSTTEQVEEGKRVRRHKLREGDLVFFHGSKRRRANHVGIYLKEGKASLSTPAPAGASWSADWTRTTGTSTGCGEDESIDY